MNKKDFFDGLSLPRNKELMRIYNDLGMVEQLGSGVPRILKVYSKDCFEFSDNFIRMIFPIKSSLKDTHLGDLSQKMSEKIVALIKMNLFVSMATMAQIIGKSSRTIEREIAKLKKSNRVKRIGSDKGGHWEIID